MRSAGLSSLLALGLAACAEKEVILPGERFDVRTPLDASIPQEGKPAPTDTSGTTNRAAPISLPGQTVNADWPQRGFNDRHLPPHAALSAQPVQIWSAPIGEANSRRYRISATPVVAGGRIFTMDAAAGVTATSTSGATLWTADMTPDWAGDTATSGGGLTYADGRLYVTSAFGELVALDPASGGVIWRQRFPAPVTGAATVADGIVYVVSRDSSAWAANAADGKLIWQMPGVPTLAGMLGAAGPAVTDSLVLLPLPSGEVVGALRRGGMQIWSTAIAGERLGRAYNGVGGILADPVVVGDKTFVGNLRGRTVALNTASGERLWTADEGAFGTLAVAGGSVFLVSDEGELVRLEASTGETVWSVPLPYFTTTKVRKRDAIYANYGPVLAGGRLVVATSDGFLRMFNPTDGALVGTVPLPGGAATAPVVAGRTLYVVNTKGQLLAFR